MKKLYQSVLLILVICIGLFGIKYQVEHTQGLTGDKVIHFFNWGDYINPELIGEFEEETGYKVVYETFDSNEAMLAKIKQGGTSYDVAVPSEYMIQTMIHENMLNTLDYSKLDNIRHIDERFLNMPFDPNNRYSIPYFWGTLGILYNTKFVDEEELQTWNDLWNPKFKNNILMYDGARETLGIGLQSQGYSLNETNTDALLQATQKMKQLMPNIRAIVADEIKMYMAKNEAAIAVTFSGEASTALDENEDLAYTIPKEGSNIWFDNIVIPKTADNLDGAYALINFLLRPDIAARNAEYIGYATPNKDAKELIDPEITSNKSFYPDDDLISRLEAYKGLSREKNNQFNDLFLEIKIENK
ncbi:extracellular solute-binding protein [Granulicatella sp. zg-ZJ]|uniref:ABC transporter substrate-binding protein n=1 Tax=Granulicatella sp. zg-ZJ TaxID=2678504 RepID=UPI0013D37084|nr:ABC transporter substrate-binding protein [Granulicatella sp. zg-ZJ]NEW62844.1 extracellular solute-binding protein [Granulicatella sp. zg-ZJ]